MIDETRVLAMYLPQFHRVKENDIWWGEGFTEWTTVRNAKSLYDSHNQPREPFEYYDLLNKRVMQTQAKLMKKYGIDGVCIYHYYFENHRKILEKPAENLLNWKDIDMPFCFYWANESWIRSWSNIMGGNSWSEIFDKSQKNIDDNGCLLKQAYGGPEDWEKHFYYMLPFFRDNRYIKKSNRPVLIIYKPDDIVCFEEMKKCWDELSDKEGIGRVFFIGKNSNSPVQDAKIIHEPQYSLSIMSGYKYNNEYDIKNVYEYDEVWKNILKNDDKEAYFCGFVGYDDTPRRGKNGIVIKDGTPEKFRNYMIRLFTKVIRNKHDFVFVNAWNEWGEGMYLEPDKYWGNKYLEALSDAIDFVRTNKEILVGCQEDVNYESKPSDGSAVINRYRYYWTVLNKWLRNNILGKNIFEYLKEHNMNTIAIYGLGMLGENLVLELKKTGIQIAYGIDRDIYIKHKFRFPIFNINDELPQVDAIIVTVESVIDELRIKTHERIPIIGLYKIVESIYQEDTEK